MKMKLPFAGIERVSLALCLVLFCLGCGGGRQNVLSATQQANNAVASRSILIYVKWPQQRRTRLLPAATSIIRVDISSQASGTLLKSVSILPGITSTIVKSLPADLLTFTATALDANNKSIAQGTKPITTQVNTTQTVSINMNTTIDHLVVSPANPSVAVGSTLQLMAAGVNTSGDMVLLTPSKLNWQTASSADAAFAAVGQSSGIVSGLKVGSANLTITDSESMKSGKVMVTVVAAGSGSGGSGGPANSGWSKIFANAQNNSLGPSSLALGTVKWTAPLLSGTGSGPVLGPNGMIIMTAGNTVYSLNAGGSLVWQLTLSNAGSVLTTPSVAADGTVYVSDRNYLLHAISAAGVEKWTFRNPAGSPLFGFPTVGTDGTIYVSSSGVCYAIAPDGSQKWTYTDTGAHPFVSNPALGLDGTIYVVTNAGNLVALNTDGSVRWQSPCDQGAQNLIISPFGDVYAACSSVIDRFSAFGAKIGTIDSAGLGLKINAIGPDGTLYVTDFAHESALNPDGTQKTLGTNPDGSPHYITFVAADGTTVEGRAITTTNNLVLISGSNSLGTGTIYAFLADGTPLWALSLNGSAAAVGADGTIYCVIAGGLVAVQ